MPTTIKLTNLSAKFLVDFITHTGWARGHEDVYRAGQLLSKVLPVYVDPDDKAPTPAEGEKAQLRVVVLIPPVAPVLNAKCEPDWAAMSKAEADDYRSKIREHNQKFDAWCRTPLQEDIVLTDKQLDTCQRVIKYYAPRTEEEKQKDREKQIPLRPELPNGEHTFLLLQELKLAAD